MYLIELNFFESTIESHVNVSLCENNNKRIDISDSLNNKMSVCRLIECIEFDIYKRNVMADGTVKII